MLSLFGTIEQKYAAIDDLFLPCEPKSGNDANDVDA